MGTAMNIKVLIESLLPKLVSLRATKWRGNLVRIASSQKQLAMTLSRLLALALCCLLISLFFIADCRAASDVLIVKSALVWRGDAQGDYLFKDSGNFSGTVIGSDGAVEYQSGKGIYELKTPDAADSLIKSITVHWAFTGKVTLEVCATGKSSDYVPVVNGVPLKKGFIEGSSLKWRATLAPGSKLTEVRVNYEDILGIESGWGNPELSGFKFRKPVFIKGAAKEELFNYPVLIKIGESIKAQNCDFYIKGIIPSDFADIRWTQTDQETGLSHWVEAITGKAPNRAASVWVNIPQIPISGLNIFLYYGKDNARDLADGQKVFDFFDDFTAIDSNLSLGTVAKRNKSVIASDQRERSNLNKLASSAFGARLRNDILEYKLKNSAEIKTLDKEKMTDEEIINFFGNGADYDWVRARPISAVPAAIDAANTKTAAEEAPNLADFQGVKVAANGDLVLEEYSTTGVYISPDYFSAFEARIMIPAWKAIVSSGNSIGVDISVDNENFKKECVSEDYYYASRKDFVKGSKLKWHVRLTKNSGVSLSPRMQYFSLDYRPGTITLVSPDGGEKLTGNSEYKIVWSAWEYEPSYRMKLEYSSDGGITYNLINEAVDNTGAYMWLVPEVSSDKVLVKISDALSADIYDVSNNVFSIIKGNAGSTTETKKTLTKQDESNLKKETQAAAKARLAEIAKMSIQNKKALNIPKKQTEEQKEENLESAQSLPEEDVDLNVDINKYLTPNRRPGTKLYDVMVKLGDNYSPNPKDDAEGSYKNGDVVLIRPHGHEWSQTERNSFLIVGMYLTEAESAALAAPKEIATGEKYENGQPVMKIVKRSLTHIDTSKFGLNKDTKDRAAKLRKIQSLTKDKAVTVQILEEK